jgi:pimeloyl-ACP methyl ester carboxylesterase
VTIELRELRANRMTFRCREVGLEGAPVIALHGFAETSRVWAPLLTALAARGLAPDQRGYSPGARPRGAQHYGYGSLASDVLALAAAAGFARFHLVGHGLGARAAWTAAQRAPESVASLALLSLRDAEPLAPEPEAERALAANDFAVARAGLSARAPAEVEEALAVLRQPGALVAACHWQRTNAVLAPWKLEPIAVPLLVVELDPAQCLEEVAAHLRAHPV